MLVPSAIPVPPPPPAAPRVAAARVHLGARELPPLVPATVVRPRPRTLPAESVDFARVGRGELVRAYRRLRYGPDLGPYATIDPHPRVRSAHPLAVLALARWARYHPGDLDAPEFRRQADADGFVSVAACYAGLGLRYAVAFDCAIAGRPAQLSAADHQAVSAGYADGLAQRPRLVRWAEALDRHARKGGA